MLPHTCHVHLRHVVTQAFKIDAPGLECPPVLKLEGRAVPRQMYVISEHHQQQQEQATSDVAAVDAATEVRQHR